MSGYEEVKPDHSGAPAEVALPPVAQQSTQERLRHMIGLLKEDFGQDFDPVREIARIGYEAIAAEDTKTALNAFQALADRMYPKLRSYEIDVSDARPDGIALQLSGLGPGFDTDNEPIDADFTEVPAGPARPDLMGPDSSD